MDLDVLALGVSWNEENYKMSLLSQYYKSVKWFRHVTGRQLAIKYMSKAQYFREELYAVVNGCLVILSLYTED